MSVIMMLKRIAKRIHLLGLEKWPSEGCKWEVEETEEKREGETVVHM